MAYYVGIFISHSWAYTGHYEKLSEWLFNEPGGWVTLQQEQVIFLDFSVPKDNPIHFAHTESQLRTAIYEKIKVSDVLVCPTGMYSTYSDWIGKEILGAQLYGKKVLAVNPWGQERKSSVVVQNAHRNVGWTKQSVVDATWQLSQEGKHGY